VVRAVQATTGLPWVVLYVRRWLQAPLRLPGGTLRQRGRGTPQGSSVSPVLANLFLHYAFDAWMALTTRSHGTVPENFWMSRSITQSVSQHRRRQAATAPSAERLGR
jgi:RNA-directed DNA polymerase